MGLWSTWSSERSLSTAGKLELDELWDLFQPRLLCDSVNIPTAHIIHITSIICLAITRQAKLMKTAKITEGSPRACQVQPYGWEVQFVLEAYKPQMCATSFCPDLEQGARRTFVLTVIQNGIVWYNHAADAFVSQGLSLVCALQPLLHRWLPSLSMGWLWGGTSFCVPFLPILALQLRVTMPTAVSHIPLVGSDFLLWKKCPGRKEGWTPA